MESIFLAAFFFPSLAAVLIFGMKYLAAVMQARVRLRQDEAYRELAREATARHEQLGETLSGMTELIRDMRTRLEAVEKLLTDVG